MYAYRHINKWRAPSLRFSFLIPFVIAGVVVVGTFALNQVGIRLPRISQLFNQAKPDAETMAAKVFDATGTATMGFTIQELVDALDRNGTTNSWHLDRESWILRVSGRDAMTGAQNDMAIRFVAPPNPNRYFGTSVMIAAQVSLNGTQLNPMQASNLLAQISTAIYLQ